MASQTVFPGWTAADFEVFEVEGLEPRMEALIQRVRPKFTDLGQQLQPVLNVCYGEEFFVHVAKHARRTVNPPNDSWVSFATNPRGYKMLPHFQVGLWSTHAFVQLAIIYECLHKKEYGRALADRWSDIKPQLPSDLLWFDDHMNPKPIPQQDMDLQIDRFTGKLINQKNSELIVGIEIPKDEAIAMSGQQFVERAERVFKELGPLYTLLRDNH